MHPCMRVATTRKVFRGLLGNHLLVSASHIALMNLFSFLAECEASIAPASKSPAHFLHPQNSIDTKKSVLEQDRCVNE